MGRKDEIRQNRAGWYIDTNSPVGYDVLINGTNKYLNFNTISWDSWYWFRDNNWVMEMKNSAWTRQPIVSWTSWATRWSITGTLSNQTDLQTALDLKAGKWFAVAMAAAL